MRRTTPCSLRSSAAVALLATALVVAVARPAGAIAPDQPTPGTSTPSAVAENQANQPAYVGAPWFQPGVAYDQNFPDPAVVWDGSQYWAYATSTGGSLLPAMSSTDLETWTPRPAYSPNPYNSDPYFSDAFPVPPKWSLGGTSRVDKAQWAPGVVRLGDSWVAYTSWEVTPGRRCISAARASSPAGPFVDSSSAPLVCDPDPAGSIDPQPFVDTNGKPYLMWKATGVVGAQPTRIRAQALSANGLSFAPGSTSVAILETELPWDGNSIENPSMVRYAGSYWLIYSGNEWASGDYRMGQARCAGPLGPCQRTSDQPLFGNSASDLGPGGGALFVDADGRLRVAYHVWNAPFTNYPANPNCDRPGECTSQGQRYLRIDGVAAVGGALTVNPIGSVESVSTARGSVTVSGWSLDPSTTESIQVHAYVDGAGTAIVADGSRPDVQAAFPGLGADKGFSATFAASPGTHQLCLYGINVGAGDNSSLGCRTIDVPGWSPFGSLDVATPRAGGITVGGWAIDPETTAPIAVHVYVDAAGAATTADVSRPDVAAVYPASGAGHGYTLDLQASAGPHSVCAYGINVGQGDNALLGCRTVVVPGGAPIGSLDTVSAAPGAVNAAGWAIDPDTALPIAVHLYVDGNGMATTANGNRPDVGAAFPDYGPAHGWSASMPASPGLHNVCAYGINVGQGGTNPLLGCRPVVVPDTSPFGNLEVARAVPGGIVVGGWAIDPDTAAPIEVHVYVGASGTALRADGTRTDVAMAYPGSGAAHGFDATISAAKGTYSVCAYGINTGAGDNRLLGCRSVSVG